MEMAKSNGQNSQRIMRAVNYKAIQEKLADHYADRYGSEFRNLFTEDRGYFDLDGDY